MVRRAGFRVFDVGALVLAFPLAYETYAHLKSGTGEHLVTPDAYWPGLVIAILLWVASSWIYQLYEAPVERTAHADIARATKSFAAAAVALAALAFLTKQETVPRLLTGFYFAYSLALLVGGRVAWRIAAELTQGAVEARRYAVVGTGGIAREIVESIAAHPTWGLEFAGFVRIDGVPSDRSRGPLIGELSEIDRILEEQVLDVVIFAVPRDHLPAIERGVHLCEEQGVEVRISLDVLRLGLGRMAVADVDGVPMLAFTRTPSDALALAAKRAFDIVASAAALLVLSPVFLVISAAIRLESGGPIFFRQRRVGLNGRAFMMAKFRSMHADAEQRLEALRAQNEMNGPVFKITNDPRITRVGRFIRRTSLDELPQFWNVLRGEMSIVGPPPPQPAPGRQYKRWQRRRLSMKPGITCIWQVSGRNNVDFDRWMELDLDYIDNWSLWSDFAICLKTIPAVLSARGAR
jgi:exopolysaccharide biosynthesis polyprenyl glycosylphosphotransferase